MVRHPARVSPYLAGILGGVVGMAVDLDHLAACLLVGDLPSSGDWSCGFGRPLHFAALLGAAVFLGYRIAHTYRLLVRA